jgi:rRNA biogenesis protein RRP5
MPKRALDDDSSTTGKAKKIKYTKNDKGTHTKEKPIASSSNLTTEEVDFPRGGGSSFTPIEVKAIRAEAHREADSELFEVCPLYILVHCNSSSTRMPNDPGRKNVNPIL